MTLLIVGLLAGLGAGLLVGAWLAFGRKPPQEPVAPALEDLLGAQHDAHVLVDPRGRIVWTNRAARALFGSSRVEAATELPDLLPHYRDQSGKQLRATRGGKALGTVYHQQAEGPLGSFAVEVEFRKLDDGRTLWSVRESAPSAPAEAAVPPGVPSLPSAPVVERPLDDEEAEPTVVVGPAAEPGSAESPDPVDAAMPAAEPHAGPAKSEKGSVLGVFEDLTRLRKEIVELRSMAEQKDRFLASLSHEMRTPMNAILGYTEMLREDLQAQGLEQYQPDLQRIERASSHLLEVINTVLDIAKIEAGRLELHPEPIDLENVTGTVLDTVRPLARRNETRLSVEIDDPGSISADPVRLKQILMNLVSNACKFTEKGEVVLSVKPRPPGYCVFEVRDTGVGIPDGEVDEVFREFTQSRTNSVGGTGLGLAISRRLARLMGGEIQAASEVGVGSTFFLVLPLGEPPATSEESA